mmetsp:Transcript_95507/g.143099  ORF Transcript_95507/g.143099 Transcript_95507/m.143099 type:complete len:90 (+) Transcript_95507:296-565(+)
MQPTEVWEDNAACIQIANNPVNRKFTRHIDVRRYFVRYLIFESGATPSVQVTKDREMLQCIGICRSESVSLSTAEAEYVIGWISSSVME